MLNLDLFKLLLIKIQCVNLLESSLGKIYGANNAIGESDNKIKFT